MLCLKTEVYSQIERMKNPAPCFRHCIKADKLKKVQDLFLQLQFNHHLQ